MGEFIHIPKLLIFVLRAI